MSNKESNAPKEPIWIPLPKDYGKKKWKQVTGSVHFECKRCGRCCGQFDIRLSPAEYEHIARLGGEYFAATGPQHIEGTEIWVMVIRKLIKDDKWVCAFLGEENKCKIYKIRPHACRNYPFFLSPKFNPDIKAGKLQLVDETHTFVVAGIPHYLFYDANCPGVKEVNKGGIDLKPLTHDLFESNLDILEYEIYQDWYQEEVYRIWKENILKDKETLVKMHEVTSAFERGDFVKIEGHVCGKFSCKRVLLYLVPGLKLALNRGAIEEIGEDERTMIKSLEAEGAHSALLFWDLFSDEKHIGKVWSVIRDKDFDVVKDLTAIFKSGGNLKKPIERRTGRRLDIKRAQD